MERFLVSLALSGLACGFSACSSSSSNSNDSSGGTAAAHGGASSGGSALASGGSASGAANASGGRDGGGGSSATSGGAQSSGGAQASGGSTAAGGKAEGGTATGGSAMGAGGSGTSAGGTASNAGSSNGGAMATGGTSAGASSGGKPGSGGAGGGSGAYNPCGNPCKILPFGDSITHGLQSSDSGGYRSQLFKLVVAAGKKVTFLGSQSDGPATVSGVNFPKNHEGHDGYTVDSGFSKYGTPGISSLIPSPAFNTAPDIVLLMIGTNDITSTSSPGSTSTRLDGLLGKIVAAAPNALVVVAKITPVSYSSTDLTNYNAKIPGIVEARVAQGQHIALVDMSAMPKSGLASDGVHPNDQGYTYMANTWFTAIQGLLPQ